MKRPLFASILLAAAAAPAAAGVENGDLLAVSRPDDSVVNIRGGGDFTFAPRFASGLSDPTGLCITPRGEVYVAESGAGRVTRISDTAEAVTFATGLAAPWRLYCDGQRILVTAGDKVKDITAGDDFSGTRGDIAVLPDFAYDITLHDGVLLVSGFGGIWDITDCDVVQVCDLGAATPFATYADHAVMGFAGSLVAATLDTRIVHFGGGGNLAADPGPVFATNLAVVSMVRTPDGLFAATANGVYEISQGGDLADLHPYTIGITPIWGGLAYMDDVDGDQVRDGYDTCPYVGDPDQDDGDGDGAGDACDGDIDGDGIVNEADPCPLDRGDACAQVGDVDGDGIANEVDLCPFVVDPGQTDVDADGIGDACDPVLDLDDGDGGGCAAGGGHGAGMLLVLAALLLVRRPRRA